MAKRHAASLPSGDDSPSIRAIPLLAGNGVATSLLTARQRHDLEAISTRLRLPSGMRLYHEGADARWVFVTTHGAVKAYRDLPSGKRQVAAFLFAGDVFGLAESGRYVNSTQTITPVTLHRIPLDRLAEVLRHDAELQFKILCKVTHALRESQRLAMTLGRHDAAGRLAMFLLTVQKHLESETTADPDTIELPMSRTDIAGYLALSLETVSRASAELERRKIVTFEGKSLVRILNVKSLRALAAAL
jgi:CRP/FNR family transcriptional regulator